VVPGDQRAGDLVGTVAAAQPAHHTVADEAQHLGAGVELDALGLAFDPTRRRRRASAGSWPAPRRCPGDAEW
jgi:hypothetical protein